MGLAFHGLIDGGHHSYVRLRFQPNPTFSAMKRSISYRKKLANAAGLFLYLQIAVR